jgi:hypothetical protein
MNTTDAKPDDQAVLQVNSDHFAEMLGYIRRLKGLGRNPATFAFENGKLTVELPDCSFSADAKGSWPGAVLVSLTDLRKIARELKVLNGVVTIRIEEDRIRIGGYSARYELKS